MTKKPLVGGSEFSKGKERPDEIHMNDFRDCDHVVRDCEWTIRDKESDKKKTKHRMKHQPVSSVLTEEMMGQLDQQFGNGLGKVTVGSELGHSKEYGCSAKAFVSFSTTCDSAVEVMQNVHDMIQPVVRALVNEDLTMMKEDRDQHLAELPRQPTEGKVAAPPQAGTPAPRAMPKGPVRTRPDFRR